jgi:biopolymer transport protein ExbD
MSLQQIERPREKLDFPFAIINVILLLLFFFIVTGSIVGKNETGVAPPLTSQLATERLPRPLLAIDKTGALYLDEVPTSLPQAIAHVQKLAQDSSSPQQVLNVITDRTFSAQRFLAIVDEIRRAGIAVRIVTVDDRAGA